MVDRAVAGEPTVPTRHGRKEAVVVYFEEWERDSWVPPPRRSARALARRRRAFLCPSASRKPATPAQFSIALALTIDPGFEDIAIAATATARGATVLTANDHFATLGVPHDNPLKRLPDDL